MALSALLWHRGCADVPQMAPFESTITLFANPPFIPANGGVSVISAVVTEAAGTPVPDGTVVQFFATIGKVDREGLTKDGVARVNFISDTRSGVAEVTAVSGPITTTLPGGISIGGVLPALVLVTADPSRITVSRSTHIFATVLDADGNPVPNIGVIFTVAQIDRVHGQPGASGLHRQQRPCRGCAPDPAHHLGLGPRHRHDPGWRDGFRRRTHRLRFVPDPDPEPHSVAESVTVTQSVAESVTVTQSVAESVTVTLTVALPSPSP